MIDYSLFTNEDEIPGEGIVLKQARRRAKGGMLSSTVSPGEAVALPNAIAQYRQRATDLYGQGEQLYNSEPDLAQMQAFAKQRGEQGDRSMLTALAAQFAGESFAPVQEQMLKKAAASRDPMKLGGGMLTSDGQFIKDPFAERDKRAEFLLQQAKSYETLAQNAQTSQERLAAQQAQNEILNQFRAMGLQIQGLNAQTARLTAGANDSNRNEKRADTLRNEYLKKAEKVREGTGHAQSVIQLLSDPTIARDPTKQVSLIFSFGKMLDPDSVVRESEYSLIANARGLSDQLQQIIPKLQTGARLTPAQLDSMRQVAQNLMTGANSRVEDLDNYYIDLAQRRNINPEDVLPSYRKRQSSPQPGGGSGGFDDPEKERRYQDWKNKQRGG